MLFIIFLNVLFGSYPNSYSIDGLNNKGLHKNRDYSLENLSPGLSSDGIVDLCQGYNSYSSVYMGTFGGVNVVAVSDLYDDILGNHVYHFENQNIPVGGNPSMVTYDLGNNETMIVVSGVESYYDDLEDLISYGTGIAWSVDSGNSWIYTDQPTDILPDCSEYFGFSECAPAINGCTWSSTNGCTYQGSFIPNDWYGKIFFSNPVTVSEKNVTYDISVDLNQGYIYIASWAGMLRRIKFTDFDSENLPQNSDWELIPLPLDDEPQFYSCGEEIPTNYDYDPVDPGNAGFGGNNNHKVFSVHVQDDTIWVGTANGINVGTINTESTGANYGCIEWEHYSTNSGANLSGDWVVGISTQYIDSQGNQRVWLLARDLISPPTPHGLSYTDNLGVSWDIDNTFDNLSNSLSSSLVYNLYFSNGCNLNGEVCDNNLPETNMFASTSTGLYKTETSDFVDWTWNKEIFPNDILFDCVQTNKVYSFIEDYITGSWLVGTPNGLIHKENINDDWNCEEYVNVNSLNDRKLNIYPNPISSNQSLNFIVKSNETNGIIDIYDFSMEKVATTNYCNQGFLNGENHLKCIKHDLNLTNGVYFCRITIGKKEYWEKLMVINNK